MLFLRRKKKKFRKEHDVLPAANTHQLHLALPVGGTQKLNDIYQPTRLPVYVTIWFG